MVYLNQGPCCEKTVLTTVLNQLLCTLDSVSLPNFVLDFVINFVGFGHCNCKNKG